MMSPSPGNAGREVVTQESLMLEAAERVARIRDGRVAYQIHLSKLRPQNRQPGQLLIAQKMLDPMVSSYRGQMFPLSNADIVFMVKDPNPNDVENLIYKLRALFSKDPLTYTDKGDGKDMFASSFDLMYDYDAFVQMCRDALTDVRRRAKEPPPPEPERLTPKNLGAILERLAIADMSRLIRRQASMVITDKGQAVVLFQEFYFYIADLQKALAPDVSLFSNRWLFQHLSTVFDQQVLRSLPRIPLNQRPPAFSLNLNIASALSPAFEEFEKAEGEGVKVFVELQVLDILADSRGYYTLRDRLQSNGHQIVIDGLNEVTMRFMDVAKFGADIYKVTWSPEWKEPDQGASISSVFHRLGTEKILMARCDSETAISWGVEHEIMRFQGRHVDAMLAAYTMYACKDAPKCTLTQCINRHGVVGGPIREECYNHAMLDSAPVMGAPKAKTS